MVHWITKDWELKEIIIDFCKLSGPHSEENLFQSFIQSCDDMRILTKVIFISSYYYLICCKFTNLQVYYLYKLIDYSMHN
jgi:hypothetical protein